MSGRADTVSLEEIERLNGVICTHCWRCNRWGWIPASEAAARVHRKMPISRLRLRCMKCGDYTDRRSIFIRAPWYQ